MNILDPTQTATVFRQALKTDIENNRLGIRIAGFLVSDDPASEVYANYTKDACRDVGIQFDLIKTDPVSITKQIDNANLDKNTHGIFVYYPIFGDGRDEQIKERVAPEKDVEGLTSYWMNKLYANQRFDDSAQTQKCILPCTPLAIIKLLEQTSAHEPYGLPFSQQTITIFNRSEVVGRPLAYMLANDGAKVYSFDVNGGTIVHNHSKEEKKISREQALREADIVITGVPSKRFEKVKASELKPGIIGLNFSYVQNFEDAAKEVASLYIPRVGPLTVTMCLRNALRLYRNYHCE